MLKSNLFLPLLIVIGCFFVGSAHAQTAAKQADAKPSSMRTAKEGVGIEGLIVGKSTMADVIKKFGKGYKWNVHKKYSFSMTYPDLGLAFYMCQSDQKKQIFDIEMREPFKVKTAKGIVLGSSTVADIERIYGKSKDGLEYKGVNFYYANRKGKKIVTVIDIIEPEGIRQCKEATAAPVKK